MTDPDLIYLIPPVISIYLSFCIAIISICKSRDSLNILFSVICSFWAITSIAYIAHQFTENTTQIILIERIVHFIYCYAPLIHIVFFHKLLNIKNNKIVFGLLPISIILSVLTFTDFYIYGLTKYNWGYIAKTGQAFYFFLLYSIIVSVYIIICVSLSLMNEKNDISKLKLRYTLLASLLAALLTMLNFFPLTRFNLYPMGNFTFIPLIFLAYGVLNYRILKIKTILYIVAQYLVEIILIILPNILILIFFRPFSDRLSLFFLVPLSLLWLYTNYYYLTKIRFLLNHVFNDTKYNLKKAESRFIEHILLLKNINELINEFIKIIKDTLQFTSVDFFIPGSQQYVFKNTQGKPITLEPEVVAWFIEKNHLAECNMVSTNPYYESCREKLLQIFKQQNCNYIIPMVQYNELVGIALLRGKNNGITKTEVRFINNVKKFIVIALYNSIIYQNITILKETLEEQTENLSKEIIERKRTEDILIESEKRYRLLAENIIDTIWVIEIPTLILTYISPSVEKLLYYKAEELTGSNIEKMLHPDSFKKAKTEINELLYMEEKGKEKSLIFEMEVIKKDKSTVWVEFSTYFICDENNIPISIIGVARDISERLNSEKEKNILESKLRQAQKMESIGVLAGGIAHDFNNILMAILGYTQLALMYIPDENQNAKIKVRQIETAGNRAKEMVTKILDFSRQSKQKKTSLNLATVISEAVSFLKSSLPSTVELIEDFQENLKPALADPIQMHQIIINLCTNSYHAMAKNGGKCHISLSNIIIDENQAKIHGINPGDYLKLSVKDTGKGMEPEIIGRIFDPYFTTKEIGKGTGMGLAVVHGIVMSHNGAITVKSEKVSGTGFTIYIPASTKEVEKPKAKEDRLFSGNESILFIDDEQVLVYFANEALKKFGYKVTATTDTGKALEIFSKNPEAFDLVITDFTMPEMTGEVLAEEIHKIRADIPIILCTGYSNPITDEAKINSGISDILIKPLSLEELTGAIRKTLGEQV